MAGPSWRVLEVYTAIQEKEAEWVPVLAVADATDIPKRTVRWAYRRAEDMGLISTRIVQAEMACVDVLVARVERAVSLVDVVSEGADAVAGA